MRKNLGKINESEEGVTLVIAVVLLAAVSFISFSISSIIIREIQGGRLTLRSEPAISGANSGGEVGLYRLFREVGGTTHTGSLVETGVNFEVTADLYDDTYEFTVAVGQMFDILLYDVENPTNVTTGYASFTLTLNSDSGSTTFNVFSWADVETPICTGSLSAGQISAPCILNKADDRYIVRVQSTGTAAVSGFVQALDDLGSVKGIPSDFPRLDVKGTNGPVQRRIEINL